MGRALDDVLEERMILKSIGKLLLKGATWCIGHRDVVRIVLDRVDVERAKEKEK